MKKLLAGLVALIIFMVLLVWFLNLAPKPSKFSVGKPLPAGKVTPRLISGFNNALLLAPDGSLWSWGENQAGVRGLLRTPGSYSIPKRIGTDTDWQKISGFWNYALALKSDGSLWGWGSDSGLQGAQRSGTRGSMMPAQIGTETNWAEVSVGCAHCLALKKDGSLWAWGQNDRGQVGNGTNKNQMNPVRIGSDTNWKSISAGAFNGYALKNDGSIWGWGLDISGAGSSRNDMLAPVQIAPGTNWTSISAHDYVLMAVKSDGTIWMGGQNASWAARYYVKSQTTNFTRIGTNTDWQEVSPGQSHFFARKRDGSWWVSGIVSQGSSTRLFGMNTADGLMRVPFDIDPWAFANGFGNSLLLTRDGTLWTWGDRIGAPSSRNRLWLLIDQLVSKLPGKFARFNTQARVTDSDPYRLWEFPNSVRQSLATNSISK